MKKNLKYEVLDKEYVVNNDGKVEALIKTIDMYKLIHNPEKEWNAVNQKLFDQQLKIIFSK
ncbi:MAG: hypothetical protein IKQ46_11895 [Bacteroidales bacterium]|nr:hypothetical protein [Bacteroidales bacterium]